MSTRSPSVDDAHAGRAVAVGADRRDAAVAHEDGRGLDAAGRTTRSAR